MRVRLRNDRLSEIGLVPRDLVPPAPRRAPLFAWRDRGEIVRVIERDARLFERGDDRPSKVEG